MMCIIAVVICSLNVQICSSTFEHLASYCLKVVSICFFSGNGMSLFSKLSSFLLDFFCEIWPYACEHNVSVRFDNQSRP